MSILLSSSESNNRKNSESLPSFETIDEEETQNDADPRRRASESESEFSFDDDDDDENETKSKKKSSINRSIEEYEAACYYLKIVPCKIVFKSLPTSSIILSNYGLTSTSVLALTQALKVAKLYIKCLIIS